MAVNERKIIFGIGPPFRERLDMIYVHLICVDYEIQSVIANKTFVALSIKEPALKIT